MTKTIVRWLLAIAMVIVGILHFVKPDGFVKIVPPALPSPLALVLISGVFEIAGGVGLSIPRVRRAAGIGLVLLYVAVFPANIYMAMHDTELPKWALYARLPFQAVFIWLALWVSSRPRTALSTR